ncbi:MAG: hypothetical protein LWX01_01605 [Deltaproteobacteria bacterium]|nr:hypothetical protein [Deltaproteobacteria bacterium]MDL1960396.1 hypothetical protein [Deltaproteobacteria bacterium]
MTALYILILGLSQCLKPGVVHAKESQVELGPYQVIISKDPFDPERGKSQPSSSAVEGDLKGEYQVYGTIIAGEMRQAFLMVATSKSASSPYKKVAKGSQKGLRTVTVGDLVDGWRVADITAQGVKFESDGEYVEVGIFDAVKKERKAISPVALQTPHPKPQVSRAHQSTPAKRASSSKPSFRSKERPGKRTSPYSKKRPAKKSQEITGETESDSNPLEVVTPPASPGGQGGPNPFLELIKKAKGK